MTWTETWTMAVVTLLVSGGLQAALHARKIQDLMRTLGLPGDTHYEKTYWRHLLWDNKRLVDYVEARAAQLERTMGERPWVVEARKPGFIFRVWQSEIRVGANFRAY